MTYKTFYLNIITQHLKMSIRVFSRVVSLASLCPVLLLQTSTLARKAEVHLTVRGSCGSCRMAVRSWKSSGLHRAIWELTVWGGGSVPALLTYFIIIWSSKNCGERF